MLLNVSLFVPLFREVRNVRATLNAYCLEPDKVPVSLDDLKYAIEQQYDVAIKHILVPLHSDLLRGLIEMYEGHSTIYLDSELPLAWTRYVVVKEMSHHLVNDAEYWTTDPSAIIEFIVQDGVGGPSDSPPKDIATEDLTKFAAVELLFPRELRQAASARINSGEDTLYTIADWLEIPEHLVELALSDRYMKFTDLVWAKLSAESFD